LSLAEKAAFSAEDALATAAAADPPPAVAAAAEAHPSATGGRYLSWGWEL